MITYFDTPSGVPMKSQYDALNILYNISHMLESIDPKMINFDVTINMVDDAFNLLSKPSDRKTYHSLNYIYPLINKNLSNGLYSVEEYGDSIKYRENKISFIEKKLLNHPSKYNTTKMLLDLGQDYIFIGKATEKMGGSGDIYFAVSYRILEKSNKIFSVFNNDDIIEKSSRIQSEVYDILVERNATSNLDMIVDFDIKNFKKR